MLKSDSLGDHPLRKKERFSKINSWREERDPSIKLQPKLEVNIEH